MRAASAAGRFTETPATVVSIDGVCPCRQLPISFPFAIIATGQLQGLAFPVCVACLRASRGQFALSASGNTSPTFVANSPASIRAAIFSSRLAETPTRKNKALTPWRAAFS
jgi:hypothetical protein